jgi:hypothetical protein
MGTVEITDSGRGGSVSYHEGANVASFDWEFALPPALALIFGPGSKVWDRVCPWAVGRQVEIYQQVAREVLRQKASGCTFELDLEAGVITVLSPGDAGPRPREGSRRPRSKLDAVAELGEGDRKQLIRMLIADGITGPVVEALGSIDDPEARAIVEGALHDQVSVDIRLAAAEVMQQEGRLPDFEAILTREIRALNRPSDGLARALRLALLNPTGRVKQALLWASWNATDCAPECARLLLSLTGAPGAPAEAEPMLSKLGLHCSDFERRAAFDALCLRLGMMLEHP